MSEIKYKYKFDKNYNPKYANGAYGGFSPQGELMIHFFMERTPLPVMQVVQLPDDREETGIEANKTEHFFEPADLRSSYVRFIETGIVINLNTAKDIVKWLNNQIETFEKINNTSE